MTKKIEQQLKIIKLLIFIRYIHEIKKALAAEQPEPAKNINLPHGFKNSSFSIHNSELLSAFEDPIGIAGGLNLYIAFGNNPVNFIDPWGLRSPGPGYYLSGYYSYWATVRGAIKQKWDTLAKYSSCMVNCMTGLNICPNSKKPRKVAPVPNYLVGDIATRGVIQYELWLIRTHPKIVKNTIVSILNKNFLNTVKLTSGWLGGAVLTGQSIYCSYICSR